MIKTHEVAKEIEEAARRGAGPPPESVQTRIGNNRESLAEWIPAALDLKLPALAVHLRTRKEMSKVLAHWEVVPKLVQLRDERSPETFIIGNGDVKSLEEAREKAELFHPDGIMLGRAIFGNPYVFADRQYESISMNERLHALASLAHTFESLTPSKSFHIFKKHIKAFVTGFDGAADLRAQLMECENAAQIETVINSSGLL